MASRPPERVCPPSGAVRPGTGALVHVLPVSLGNVRCGIEHGGGRVQYLKEPDERTGRVIGTRVATRLAHCHRDCPAAVPVVRADYSLPVLAAPRRDDESGRDLGRGGRWRCWRDALAQEPLALAHAPIRRGPDLVARSPVRQRCRSRRGGWGGSCGSCRGGSRGRRGNGGAGCRWGGLGGCVPDSGSPS